MNICYLQSKKN